MTTPETPQFNRFSLDPILKTKDGKTKSKARRGNEGRKLGRSFGVQ